MTASPSLPPPPASATLPVRGSAREIGLSIHIAPGADGTVFVSVPDSSGAVLALIDATGRPRPGWPIAVRHSTGCGLPLAVEDGSVRIVCNGTDLPQFDNDPSDVRAFAFDASGRLMAGWPVEVRPGMGHVVGEELTIVEGQQLTDVYDTGTVDHEVWLTRIAANGAMRSGVRVPMVASCCGERWAVGPDGIAYGVAPLGELTEQGSAELSQVTALDLSGVRAGWPVQIDGMASTTAFDAAGRIHVTVGTPWGRPARTIVFDPGGRAVVGGSGRLDIAAPSEFAGIEGTDPFPVPPLVGPDGTTFLVDVFGDRTIAVGLTPSGQVMAGWPYRSGAVKQSTGFCPAGEVCEGSFWATPAVGPGNVLYLVHAAATTSVGGSIVAVGPDGRVRPGWPVELRRPGAAFWSVVVGTDGIAYALAIEPEAGDASSASILAIAPDSTVLWTTTIIDP